MEQLHRFMLFISTGSFSVQNASTPIRSAPLPTSAGESAGMPTESTVKEEAEVQKSPANEEQLVRSASGRIRINYLQHRLHNAYFRESGDGTPRQQTGARSVSELLALTPSQMFENVGHHSIDITPCFGKEGNSPVKGGGAHLAISDALAERALKTSESLFDAKVPQDFDAIRWSLGDEKNFSEFMANVSRDLAQSGTQGAGDAGDRLPVHGRHVLAGDHSGKAPLAQQVLDALSQDGQAGPMLMRLYQGDQLTDCRLIVCREDKDKGVYWSAWASATDEVRLTEKFIVDQALTAQPDAEAYLLGQGADRIVLDTLVQHA